MVEEGLGLDVAGGREILTAVKAGIDPGLMRPDGPRRRLRLAGQPLKPW
jgi:diaminopimelate decarboxylase